MKPPKIAIMYGRVDASAAADEKDVLVQAETVRAAVHRRGHETMDVPVTLDLGVTASVLRSAGPLVAFNLVETIDGKGSLIHLAPSLLDCLRIPYTGASCEAILLTSHKVLAKKSLAAAGIATPAWATAAAALREGVPFPPPWIVKSVWEHASIGLQDSSVACSRSDLEVELRRRAGQEGAEGLFVEAFIEGRELNLAILGDARGPRHLPPAEIEFIGYPEGKPRMVGYRAKWDEGSFEYGNTPRRFDFPPSDGPLLRELERLAGQCWHHFGLRGYARVDFRVDAAGRAWVLEVNTNPCLSPDAGFMAAAGQAGLGIDEVVRRVIAAATDQTTGFGEQERLT